MCQHQHAVMPVWLLTRCLSIQPVWLRRLLAAWHMGLTTACATLQVLMTDNEPKVLAILNDCAASNFEQAAAGPQLGHVGVAQPHAAAREQHTVPANMADQQDAAAGAADLADPDDASSCEDLDDFLQPQTGHQEPGMTQTWDHVSTLLHPESLWWRLEAASRWPTTLHTSPAPMSDK